MFWMYGKLVESKAVREDVVILRLIWELREVVAFEVAGEIDIEGEK